MPTFPHFNKFREITLEGEKAGLYENPKTIGFKKNWENLQTTTLLNGKFMAPNRSPKNCMGLKLVLYAQ